MLLVRQVFQAKYGKGNELVELFKEFNSNTKELDASRAGMRILTDASGPFFTVVTEFEAESFSAWESMFQETMQLPWMGDWFGRMVPLVESGSREFYNIAS
jgi:hypothetical protein